MKRSLADLNEYLFDQLDRLSNESLSGEALAQEINRSNALTRSAERVIAGADLTLKALKMKDDAMDAAFKLPGLLSGGE